METLDKYRSYLLIGLAVLVLLLLAAFTDRNGSSGTPQRQTVDAASDEKTASDSTKAPAKTTSPPRYTYTAQSGDSYTKLARKAVQTYGIVNKVTLSQAQIVAAETLLTQSAASPELNEAQQVTLPPAQVKAAVDAALKLTAQDQAAWQQYIADIDFNTDAVGNA